MSKCGVISSTLDRSMKRILGSPVSGTRDHLDNATYVSVVNMVQK